MCVATSIESSKSTPSQKKSRTRRPFQEGGRHESVQVGSSSRDQMSDRDALLRDSYEDAGEIKSLRVTVNGRDPQAKGPEGTCDSQRESGLEINTRK